MLSQVGKCDLRFQSTESLPDLAVPLWELSTGLQALSLDVINYSPCRHEGTGEVTEDSLTAAEGLLQRRIAQMSSDDVEQGRNEDLHHDAIACRMIIAAAQGGRLKRLTFTHGLELPFAVRALVPYWVHIEDWGRHLYPRESWIRTARLLRPFLAHLSHRQNWIEPPSISDARNDRRLTHHHLQSLPACFADVYYSGEVRHAGNFFHDTVDVYLRWLAEDEEVRAGVLEAWNSIVDRGEEDKVKCSCLSCGAIYAAHDSYCKRI